jgi:hypothetical protein
VTVVPEVQIEIDCEQGAAAVAADIHVQIQDVANAHIGSDEGGMVVVATPVETIVTARIFKAHRQLLSLAPRSE